MLVKSKLKKTALIIPNREGKLMYAVMSEPLSIASTSKVVIFCHPGPNDKAETGDFLRYLGNSLSQDGYHVLRFDQTCTGESQGEITEPIVMGEFYQKIQTGMSVKDTQDIIDWVNENFPNLTIYLLGYCAGCHSALLASQKGLEKIAGFILIAVPVIYSIAQGEKEEMRQFDTLIVRRGYMKKLLQPTSYLRLIKGESDLALIKDALTSSIRNLLKNRIGAKWNKNDTPNHQRFNIGFWKAFQFIVQARKKILFLMAELDNETPDFNAEFKIKVLDKNPIRYASCSVKYLIKSDHALMFEEPRNEAVQTIKEWLNNA